MGGILSRAVEDIWSVQKEDAALEALPVELFIRKIPGPRAMTEV